MIFAFPIAYNKSLLIVSVGLTAFLFYGVDRIPSYFLTSLVTLDGFLIAIIGIFIAGIFRAVPIEELRNWLKLMEKSPNEVLRKLSLGGLRLLSAAHIIIPVWAVMPYFCSAIFTLIAMLTLDPLVVKILASLAFCMTLFSFLALVRMLWNFASTLPVF